MRPNQNRRVRGRNRPNKGPNPLTRSFESNGPDVKIRGTAQHVADKYAQLARDAQASGDPVSAESYFQHAEHYYRLIAAAQEQFRAQYGQRFEEDGEEGDEDGFGAPGQGGDEFGDAPGIGAGSYDGRPEPRPASAPARFDRPQGGQGQQSRPPQQQRFDRNDRNGGGYDRNAGGGNYDRGGNYGDRQAGQDRQQGGQERQGGGYDRQGGQERQNGGYDRQAGGDRHANPERPQQAERPERQQNGERPDRQHNGERRERFQPRDNNGGREGFGPREPRADRGGDPRRDRQPSGHRPERGHEGGDEREAPAGELPAFLTTPVRSLPQAGDEGAPIEATREAGLIVHSGGDAPEGELNGIRPRRRRTRKPEVADEGGPEPAPGATEPTD